MYGYIGSRAVPISVFADYANYGPLLKMLTNDWLWSRLFRNFIVKIFISETQT